MTNNPNASKTEKPNSSSCATTGSCLTAQRMCPGVALFIAYVIGYGALYVTGSEAIGIGVGISLFVTLVTGIHSLLWNKLQNSKDKKKSA